jgi:glycolate oxidase FAD binding subunit
MLWKAGWPSWSNCYKTDEPLTTTLTKKLAGLLGNDALLSSHLLGEYTVDGLKPQAVVRPTSREAIAEVMRWAASEKLAVLPRGGGTQLSLGNSPARVDLVLDLSQFNQMLDFQPADLTATIEAGINLETLQRGLAQGGKLIPLEAPLAHKATIGGILAANASGPLRYSYGLARDWLIGISVVGADGVETKTGGKVVKNVTGYDLNKLYTGSLGTLGIIVEATFKLAPVSTDFGALVAVFASVPEAVDRAREVLNQVYAPQGIQVVNAPAGQKLGLPIGLSDSEAAVLAFSSGRHRAVQRRLDDSSKLLRDGGARELERLEAEPASYMLRQLTDLGWSTETIPQLGLKINLPPSAVGQMATWPTSEQASCPTGIVADPGFGQVHFFWWAGTGTQDLEDRTAMASIDEIRKLTVSLGGSAVVEHCPRSIKQQIDVWGDSVGLIGLMTRIKHNLDPAGILNPGRFMGKL